MNPLRWLVDRIRLLRARRRDADGESAQASALAAAQAPPRRDPGLDCPKCKFRIQVSLPMLLSGDPITCPRCLLELTVDREKSKGALDAAAELYAALRRAEEAKTIVS